MRMMQTLKSNNVTMINAHEVKMAQEKGVNVLDVRTAKQYEEVSHSNRFCLIHQCL